jgi:MFS family permease
MLGRLSILIPVAIASGLAGLVLGAQQGAAASWFAVALSACAGLVIGPVIGTALIAALPDVPDTEKWGPRDLFLPALTSSAAFCFVFSQVAYLVLEY